MIQMENNSGSHCWIPASQTQSLGMDIFIISKFGKLIIDKRVKSFLANKIA